MLNDQIARDLLAKSADYHETLTNLARGINRFQSIIEFLVRCIDFAQSYIPDENYSKWIQENPYIPLVVERARPLFTFETDNPVSDLDHLLTATTSGSSDAFAYLMDNYNYYETKDSRADFLDISISYRALLSRPEDIEYVQGFLRPINSVASEKFGHSFHTMASLPGEEDPQGPLLEMRSAIDLTLDTLLKHTPLSRSERGDLKGVQVIPAIANYLAKDDLSKIDLIMANAQFEQIKAKLAASKNVKLPRDQAEVLMAQSVALLSQIAKAIELPNDSDE